mgnify:CR=1 FL=1
MKTLEQERASYAFDIVRKVKGRPYEKEFASLVSKLPTLILSNGFGNTLAFLYSKSKIHHLIAIGVIANWLLNKSDLKIVYGRFQEDFFDDTHKVKESIEDVLNSLVINANIDQYTFVAEEALRLLNWLKRFSEAILEKGDENG